MRTEVTKKQIYIVISQTGTILSRILKIITSAEYNHASISMTDDLRQMYSFGRMHPYNPLWGGFILESPHEGTFKRFSKTKVIVLAVDISKKRYIELCEILQEMYLRRKRYRYNYVGLFLAALHIRWKQKNCYYCSEFVRYMLLKGSVKGADGLRPIVEPMHFLEIPHRKVYCGRLNKYQLEH